MGLFEYRTSQEIAAKGYPFHALIMAAARKADTFNFEALKQAFPGTIDELTLRYNAPGGVLPHERASYTGEAALPPLEEAERRASHDATGESEFDSDHEPPVPGDDSYWGL